MSISIGVGLFLLALGLSVVIVPQFLYLRLLQALIYVAVLVLTRRTSPWGYGIGVIVPTAWNSLNLFVTHLIHEGAVQFWSPPSTFLPSQPRQPTANTTRSSYSYRASGLLQIAVSAPTASEHENFSPRSAADTALVIYRQPASCHGS